MYKYLETKTLSSSGAFWSLSFMFGSTRINHWLSQKIAEFLENEKVRNTTILAQNAPCMKRRLPIKKQSVTTIS